MCDLQLQGEQKITEFLKLLNTIIIFFISDQIWILGEKLFYKISQKTIKTIIIQFIKKYFNTIGTICLFPNVIFFKTNINAAHEKLYKRLNTSFSSRLKKNFRLSRLTLQKCGNFLYCFIFMPFYLRMHHANL